MLTGIFGTIDLAQFAVAATATASYACTSLLVQRAYVRRRRRQARRNADFIARVIEGAGTGTVTTLAEAAALYRACCLPSSRDEFAHQRLDFLIRRAFFRELRQSFRRRHRLGVSGAALVERQTGTVLRQLVYESHAATMEELVRNAGVSAANRDLIRLEAARSLEDGANAVHLDPHVRLKQRTSQRRTASLLRGGLMGAGCIAFVEVVLVVWHSLP